MGVSPQTAKESETHVSVFFDSSVWNAAMDSNDGDNARAKAIIAGREPPYNSHVLIETWRLIRHRALRQLADNSGMVCGTAGGD
jgi:predicted nucleic acid-binding protein